MDDRPTILVADDPPMNVRVLVHHLKEDYRLLEAEDGFQAYTLAVEEQPDLILLDVMMPGRDGLEVCSMLKTNQETRDIPVILLATETDIVDKVQRLELGVDYILKPSSSKEISARIRTQLRVKALHEENLRQQSALLEAQKLSSIGRLAAGVAHNFHNLLNTVVGYVELIQLRGEGGDELADDLDRILTACRRMVGITQQLMDFAQLGEHRPSKVSAAAFLCHLIELFKAGTGDRIDIRAELAPDLPFLWIDEQRMSQALMDLLINAYEAMPNGGSITVSAEILPLPAYPARFLSAPSEDGWVRIRITDMGIGMDEELIATIFEPFVSTKHMVGVGMGLSSAYGLIRSVGGYMDVESEPGKGTTLYVYLPVMEREVEVENVDSSMFIREEGGRYR